MKLLGYLASALAFAVSVPAAAHVRLVYPPPRYPAPANEFNVPDPQLKEAPCGVAGDSRTSDQSRITTFMAGETITVQFDETVPHESHFRIAFDEDGQDALVDPNGFDDIRQPGLPIILDGIPGGEGGLYEAEITLPNVPCTNCTLQLIQLMTDKPPYGDGDDVYHQCADIVLTAPGSGGNGGSGGTGVVPGGSGGALPTGGNVGTGGVPVGSGGATTSGGAPTSGAGGAPTGSGGSSSEPTRRPLPDGGCSISSGGAQPGRLGLWAFLALCLSLRRARPRR